MHELDWAMREVSKREWAKMRAGKSVSHIDKFWHDDVEDKLMQEYLQEEGVIPKLAQTKVEGKPDRA
jgi:hypothetical protein